jgi:hypothetical protein
MVTTWMTRFALAGLVACSGSDPESRETLPLTGAADGDTDADDTGAEGNDTGTEDADTGAQAVAPDPRFSVFVDMSTGYATDAVHDADREVVHFDAALGAMVSDATGDAVGGWSVMGSDLRWTGIGVAFRVRFGTEAGERRAYFTEAGPGTICDLNLVGPDMLFISGTRETPPNP